MAAESFVVFTDYWSGMTLLTREQRGDLLEALMAMHGACEMPELDQATAIVLAMMRPRMEANRRKYEETLEKRKAAGHKGGQPKQSSDVPDSSSLCQTAQSTAKQTEAMPSIAKQTEAKPSIAKQTEAMLGFAPPVYGSGSVYVNTTYSEEPPFPPLRGDAAGAAEESAQGQDSLACEQPAPEPAPAHSAKPVMPSRRKDDFTAWYDAYPRKRDRDDAVKAWDAACRAKRLPELPALLETLAWQKESQDWVKDGGQWIPYPGKYLRAGSWQDEKPARQPPRRRSYAPDVNGRTPYVHEDEMDFDHVPRTASGDVDWLQVLGGAK